MGFGAFREISLKGEDLGGGTAQSNQSVELAVALLNNLNA